MNFTAQAESLLQKLEGLRLNAYQDSGGVWTIGYGHTGFDVNPYSVITLEQAQELLQQDLAETVLGVQRAVTAQLNDNEFSAVVILTYNIGIDAFLHSRLLMFLNAYSKSSARIAWAQWCHIKGVVCSGLVSRRAVEISLFNQPLSTGTSNA